MIPKRILIVDDEPQVRHLFAAAFADSEYEVIFASTGTDALTSLAKNLPEIVLLDQGLPDMDGLEVLKTIRLSSQVPVIMISAYRHPEFIREALDAGAKTCLPKPFGVAELLGMIRQVFRSRIEKQANTDPIVVGPIYLDPVNRHATVRDVEIKLSPIEWKLLLLLASSADFVITDQQILEKVWGPEYVEDVQYLPVYIKYLRNKVETDPSNPKIIVSESGVGYMIKSTGY